MCFILLSRHNLALFFKPGHLMVHAPDCKQFLLEELLSVDQVCPSLANCPGDLLASSLRCLLQRDFLVKLGIDLLLELDVDQSRITNLLLCQSFLLLGVELLLQHFGSFIVLGVDTGGVLVVEPITSLFELVCQLFKTILIVHEQIFSPLLQISLHSLGAHASTTAPFTWIVVGDQILLAVVE